MMWQFVTMSGCYGVVSPLSIGLSRQEYWSGLPPPGDLPDPGIEPVSPVAPALQADSFTAELSGKPHMMLTLYLYSQDLSALYIKHDGIIRMGYFNLSSLYVWGGLGDSFTLLR